MKEYHKIQTVYLRDEKTNYRTLLEGQFALPEFEYLQNNEWIWTEKVDGTNIRVMFDGEEIKFGGRTNRSQVPSFLLDKLNVIFNPLKEKFSRMFENGCCLYGEGYGARIQKGGGNYRRDVGFVLFDIKIGDWWLKRTDIENIAKELGIDIVPIIGRGTLHEMVKLVKTGFKSRWGDFLAEGIVARPAIELKTRAGRRIITKVKHKDFMVKGGMRDE